MVQQAQVIVGKGIPRPIDRERASGLAGQRVAQVGSDAAVIILEALERLEGGGGVEVAQDGVEPATRNLNPEVACEV